MKNEIVSCQELIQALLGDWCNSLNMIERDNYLLSLVGYSDIIVGPPVKIKLATLLGLSEEHAC